jgi:hypothetical protein
MGKLEEIFRFIDKKNSASDFKFWDLKEKRVIELSLKTIQKKTRQLPCYAGLLEGTLYSNGDVAFCEFTKPFGNVRDFGFNFHKLWNSDQANGARKLITKCSCIHSCTLGTALHLNDPGIVNEALMR